jgi:hypothetical protein
VANEIQVPGQGNALQQEPVLSAASIVGLITGIVSYAVAKGWFDAADEALLIGLAPTIAGVVIGVVARRWVTPTAKAEKAIDLAKAADPVTGQTPVL